MKGLKGACIFGQSGGPTSVINASAAGVFTEALKQKNITAVYGAAHGIKGILDEKFYDISKESEEELKLLKNTPSSALGSVRYKLKDADVDETDYKRLLEVFKKYNIRYFFYNGGNDSMDTCNKISKYMQKVGYDCNVIGVPKTIDNDLYGTDHCPGYGSAAKYIATTLTEISLDANVYNTPNITVVEIMGRNAGWLTAASALSKNGKLGPNLIYLPEVPFCPNKFREDIQNVLDKNNGKCIVAVSEGVKNRKNKYMTEVFAEDAPKDAFGHTQLGGLASSLAQLCANEFGVKTRGIEFSLMQRCAAHLASKVDVNESFKVGQKAVRAAVSGKTDYMVAIERSERNGKYVGKTKLVKLELCANTEKKVPLEWICDNGTNVTQDFIDYALPLIQGEARPPFVNGLPRFANLKKVLAKK